ncbi:MAG: hypothetical protein WC410_03540 [Candidatus Paceibacterota bacterium]|nr:hypothetical protein [Candidatus Paceibacterota bacterium]
MFYNNEIIEACRIPGGKEGSSAKGQQYPLVDKQKPNNRGDVAAGDIIILSGTVTDKIGQSLTIETDNRDSKTIIISDSTQIFRFRISIP